MNMDSASKGLESARQERERAQQERQQAQTQEAQKFLEKLKSDFQSSLLAESQSFKSSIVATERRFKWLCLIALALTVSAVLCSTALLLASVSMTRKMNHQAESFRQQMLTQDPYAALRQQKLIPFGETMTIKNHIVVQLKKTE